MDHKKNVTSGNVYLDYDGMIWCAVCEHGDKLFKVKELLKQPSCHQLLEKAFCSMKFIFSYTKHTHNTDVRCNAGYVYYKKERPSSEAAWNQLPAH
jgi:hypothetical protein